MQTKEAIQKKYFQLITSGHYIDVQNNESQWVMARVVDKDKKFIYVAYDGEMNKQDNLFINSYRVAPLRAFTEGFTGSHARCYRANMPKICDLKNYIEIARQKFFNQQKANPFEITQLLRGQLFVYVHDLLCKQYALSEGEVKDVNFFFDLFIGLVLSILDKAIEYQEEYFSTNIGLNKLAYLMNSKVALVESLTQLLVLLQYLLKVDNIKYGNVFKYNKSLTTQEALCEYFMQKKGLIKLYQVFVTNDKNGRWFSSSIRKSCYKIMLKYALTKTNSFKMPQLPKYQIKDFQEFYSIYPFMCKYSPEIQLENQYVDFSINVLMMNAPFDAKLKSIQELRKVIEGKNQFQFLDKGKIVAKIDHMGVLQQLLDNKSFNPQVFKRFVPILSTVCKVKSLSLKNIHALFQIIKERHESETGIIFEIISEISEFAPSSLLDNVYTEICKIDINSEQTMNFIKTFTMKAIQNLSKEKSILSGWFGKKKGSSKYGYYGLNMLFKQSLDEGKIVRQKVIFALNIVKQLLSTSPFNDERWNHLALCVDFVKKRKNFGQSIKLIYLIVSTFDEITYITQDRKKAIQKLQAKYNVIDLIVEGFKNIESVSQVKVTHNQCFQYFYDLIESFSLFIKAPLKVNHIEYLWSKCDSTSLLKFLKKPKQNQRFKKLIAPQVIEEIFNVILKKPSFYKRQLTFQQFETIYELFLSYHLQKENIVFNTKDGLVRYVKPNLLGFDYFINFLEHYKQQKNYQKAVKKSMQLILRPSVTKDLNNMDGIIRQKVQVWKQTFKLCIQRLISNPKKCLQFVQFFYQLIEGKLFKQIQINDMSNAEILVEYGIEIKMISIERYSTIFRLRKLVQQKFKLSSDFLMFNVKLNKYITFQEEEDFSVNAMPLMDNGRAVSVKIQLKPNKYHQQDVAILLFKQQIQKQEKLYHLIFKIIQQKELSSDIEKLFWKSIELLPLNKSMMSDVQKCDHFTIEKWVKYFDIVSESSLQYKLSIILHLINISDKWANKMQQNHGLLAIILTFIKCLQKWCFKFENQALSLKIMEVIEKLYEKCPKRQLQNDILKQTNISLIKALSNQFSVQIKSKKVLPIEKEKTQDKISVQLINKGLSLYLSNLKTLTNSNENSIPLIKVEMFLQILNYVLFLKKSEATQKFADQVSISLNFALYDKLENKKIILWKLIENLNLQLLLLKQRTQNYFKFLITILYSFEQTQNKTQKNENQVIESNKSINEEFNLIWKFISEVISNLKLKDQQKSGQQIIYGSLSLLKFILSKVNEGFIINLHELFQQLINCFVFPSNLQFSKRIKTEKNKKILFELLKKIAFQEPEVLTILIEKLKPFLQNNKFRKNTVLSWNLRFEHSQKKLFVGLQNLGATCYINCLFQQLFMIERFRQQFMAIESRPYKQQADKNQIYQLQQLFYILKYGNHRSESTKSFCQSFITFQGESINPMVQSDADEFLNTLMDRIQTFLKQVNKHQILQTTFQGKLSNQLNCEGCPHRSQKIQPFMSIGVNLKNKKTLEQALRGYVEGEILDGDNAYFCEICQKKVRTVKRLCIKQLPNILVVVLKRFQYDFDAYKKIKINSYLEFPEKLNMTEYTSDYIESKSLQKIQHNNAELNEKNTNQTQAINNNFHLRGAVIHAGYSDAGHYYSFIKQKEKWYQFNDEFIKQINYSKIQEEGFGGEDKDSSSEQLKMEKYKNAYILFYERQAPIQQPSKQMQPKQQMQMNHKLQQTSSNEFSTQMIKKILDQNHESSMFASLIEPNFIHFWQNLSILQNTEVKKFIFLYFHSVVLRDKMKYEYATNLFRIILKYFTEDKKKQGSQDKQVERNSSISEWFLAQIDKAYVKEFLIEAPKTIRLICTSLVLTAIHYAEKIPERLPAIFLSCLKRTGMAPFGNVFVALLKRSQTRQILKELKYFEYIVDILFNDKKVEQLQLPQIQISGQGYFGKDSAQAQMQKQKCSIALLQSLNFYQNISMETLFKINDSYSFRLTNKFAIRKISEIVCQDVINGSRNETDVLGYIKMFEEKISANNCGREFVEKYLFFMRYLTFSSQKTSIQNKIIEMICSSIKDFISFCSKLYEPMDWTARQLIKIASKSSVFKKCWQKKVEQNQGLKLQIQSWLKQVQKPHYINVKDDFFDKIRQMDMNEKAQYLKNYSKKMKLKTYWMFDQQNKDLLQGQESDFQNVKQNEVIQVRNRIFIVKEKFQKSLIYQVAYPEKEDNLIWAYLQKCDIDTFINF